ncbi:MAG: 16S rRNA (guanine(966)-N(2))-methyltransferase RsmD [Bacillota bacterium]|nr:16S rRNA (guanine(966)-N(2))-methyltransferase RsmD [Bacillota bacterium]
MRIITGSLKGRRLKSPKSNDVRPTSDKVKEAMFDMLYPYIQNDFVCMDVFAGTGNLGLEAISRGAKLCYFSDSSRDSLALVKENIKYCNVEDNAVLLAGDFKSNIKRVHDKVDIFFIDPPYAQRLIPEALKAIEAADNLAEDGIIVCEHDHKDVLPEEILCFKAIKQRKYGVACVTMYQKA